MSFQSALLCIIPQFFIFFFMPFLMWIFICARPFLVTSALFCWHCIILHLFFVPFSTWIFLHVVAHLLWLVHFSTDIFENTSVKTLLTLLAEEPAAATQTDSQHDFFSLLFTLLVLYLYETNKIKQLLTDGLHKMLLSNLMEQIYWGGSRLLR